MQQIIYAVFIYQIVSCDSRISFLVYTGQTKNEVFVDYYGNDDKIVTSLEERLFNITGENLKRGVEIDLGRVPDDVFLKGPTRYGKLHKKYNWTPVTRRVQVKEAEVIEVISDKVVVKSQDYINNATKAIKCNVVTNDKVEDAVSSVWSEDGWPDDEIDYDIRYSFEDRAVMYRNRWRHDNKQSESLPFAVKKNGYINIEPGQRVTSRLTGSETRILIKIQFEASLVGQVVLNYDHAYVHHHFWAPRIGDIMEAAGLKNEIVTSELIEVRYYTKPELEVFDSVSKRPLDLVPYCYSAELGLVCSFNRTDQCPDWTR